MQRYIGTKIIHAEREDRDVEGFKVVYADGYTSWSPKGVFDDAYRLVDGMTFGLAIEALKQGRKVTRSGWNGKGMWLELQLPDSKSKMTLPYIFLNYPAGAKTTPGARVPWLASQTDVLADDWCLLSE